MSCIYYTILHIQSFTYVYYIYITHTHTHIYIYIHMLISIISSKPWCFILVHGCFSAPRPCSASKTTCRSKRRLDRVAVGGSSQLGPSYTPEPISPDFSGDDRLLTVVFWRVARSRKEDHFPHTEQGVNSTCMLIPGRVDLGHVVWRQSMKAFHSHDHSLPNQSPWCFLPRSPRGGDHLPHEPLRHFGSSLSGCPPRPMGG